MLNTDEVFSGSKCNDSNHNVCRCVTQKICCCTVNHSTLYSRLGGCDAAKQAGHHGIGSPKSP